MNIPPKYEDVVAQLSAALDRESVLVARSNQNKLMMDSACGEIATLQEELAEFELVQQRLTVAERRAGELKKLLCAVINESPTGFADLKVDLANRVSDALQPAEVDRDD